MSGIYVDAVLSFIYLFFIYVWSCNPGKLCCVEAASLQWVVFDAD
jgi:hypothetical protein